MIQKEELEISYGEQVKLLDGKQMFIHCSRTKLDVNSVVSGTVRITW